MTQRSVRIVVLVLTCIVALMISGPYLSASAQTVPFAAPEFELRDGNRQVLHLSDLSGVIVGFYETNDTKEKNHLLKSRLEAWAGAPGHFQPPVQVLAIADCSSAPGVLVGLWEAALVAQSRALGRILYGDWSGQMGKAYGFKKDDANFFVIDENRQVVYRSWGRIVEPEITTILHLLEVITQRSKP